MPTAKTDQSREQKYTVPGVDIDNLSITFDGKADGPGPGHYRSPEEVMIAAANWIWVYAQAAQQLGQPGRGGEWTTYIFSDASTGMYGFTTPEPQAEAHAHETDVPALRARLPDRIGTVFGTMHSHPRGRPTTAGLTEAMGGETKGVSASDVLWETLSGSENHSDFDHVDAYRNPTIWHVLLTPKGAVKAIKVKGEARTRVEKAKAAARATGAQVDSKELLPRVLKDDALFHHWPGPVRRAAGAFWQPDRDWFKPRVEYVKREMSHRPIK